MKLKDFGAMIPRRELDIDYSFLAKVLPQNVGCPQRGTGILVSPEYVLTCAHVMCIELAAWNARRYAGVVLSAKTIFNARPDEEIERSATLVGCAYPDMALLHLEQPVGIPPARFVAGLRGNHDSALFRKRPRAIGFSLDRLIESDMTDRLPSVRDSKTKDLINLQVKGGLLPGMSGGALVAQIQGRSVCFGMTYLGGDRSASSRIILSDILLEFLYLYPVNILSPVPAEECLAESLGQIIERRREARHLSRSQLAMKLGIGVAMLEEWEIGANSPGAEYRMRLYEELIVGNTEAEEAWQQLTLSGDTGVMPDAFAEARRLAKPGRLSVELVDAYRTIGIEPRPQRPQLAIGSRVKILVDLPWCAHVSVLNIQGMESVSYSAYCLDPLLGFEGPLAKGETRLPPGGKSLPVGDPPSLNCLILFARKSGAVTWTKRGTTIADRITAGEIVRALRVLGDEGDDQFFTAIYEYEVVE